MDDRTHLLERLSATVAELVAVTRGIGPEAPVNSAWSVKDALGHLAFWHESFARNVSDLAASVEPTPLRGTYAELGRRCMAEMQPLSAEEILARLVAAQARIEECILDPRITSIPYRKGSRDYAPEEHLAVVNDHIRQHLAKIRAASR